MSKILRQWKTGERHIVNCDSGPINCNHPSRRKVTRGCSAKSIILEQKPEKPYTVSKYEHPGGQKN